MAISKEIWEWRNPGTWLIMSNVGSITRCTLAKFKTLKGKSKPGDNQLYKILIAESVILIWHLRNQRVRANLPKDAWPTKEEVRNKWISRISAKLTLDWASTNKKYRSSATKKSIVLKTWSGTLKNKHTLPDDWINMPRVLVGMDYQGQRERECISLLCQPVEPPWITY